MKLPSADLVGGSSFIPLLTSFVPELQPIYAEHLHNNDDLLPHVFLGDVARFAIAAALDVRQQEVLMRLLKCMETGLESGPAHARELILASFVENLLGEDDAVRRIKLLMGPNLRKATAVILG